MKLTIEEAVLARAQSQLSDAASTGNTGRSYPTPEMLTDAADTVRSYIHAVRIASDAIIDGADYAATSAADIVLGLDEVEGDLARRAAP